MSNTDSHIEAHCREIIRACLNIVEEKGDTYVAIHKEEDCECIVLVSLIRAQKILSVMVADRILFAAENSNQMYRTANDLNSESISGWHSIILANHDHIYMYRRSIWMSGNLYRDQLMDILCDCINEYKTGRKRLSAVN